MENILFICTGNTCRSPMAEGIFNKLAKDNSIDAIASSAGLWAADGMKVSDHAVEAVEQYNVDISDHLSSPLTIEVVEGADLILTMTDGHKMQLLNALEEGARYKVYTLKEYVYGDGDINIMDPFGLDLDTYIATAGEIYNALDTMINRIAEKIK